MVPLVINTNMSPMPTGRRCRQLGEALRDYIENERPADERVVVLATGGLSHWLKVGGSPVIEEFDKKFLEDFVVGKIDEYEKMTDEEIIEEIGDGGLELRFWMAMLACAPNKTNGETIFYQPLWSTGLTAVEMKV